MSAHTIKGLRQQFKAVGKFHTPPELALKLASYLPDDDTSVYDPTCGAGNLLAVFPDHVEKFGQDIDAAALEDASLIPRFFGAHGDVLTHPKWAEPGSGKFCRIVANPPFSVKWTPNPDDHRFVTAPTVPTQGRADWAFILHVLYMLSSQGTAAMLTFPGALYRGGREQQIRKWVIEQGWVEKVVSVPGNTFEDTTISTAILVLKKGRVSADSIHFVDEEHGVDRHVSLAEVRNEDWTLSVSAYVEPPVPEVEPVDAWELEQLARCNAVRKLRGELNFSKAVARMEGWPFAPFLDELEAVIEETRKETVT